ncbi:MAG: diaminopimelate epimerase [Rickettsia sp.]|nr:diaminopimelate epimerase [Rickettsia sp.]
MKKIFVHKMHVLGNDFVIIDENELLHLNLNYKILASSISNIHTSVGCDQLIIYKKSSQYKEISMLIFNKDGSEADMCGNACFCLAKIFFDKFNLQELSIRINNHLVKTKYLSSDVISINIGSPNLNIKKLENLKDLYSFFSSYNIDPKEICYVDVANPHLVFFVKLDMKDQKIIGSQLQTIVQGGINVNFAYKKDDAIYLNVWERGSGFTLACGSGASASFAAARKLGFIENQVKIIFPLGELQMSINSLEEVLIQGRANYIFQGDLFIG